tara:strand:- start:3510 stop:3713 length:204 start_codon:yes stop_codon:yes gene_type:complete
MMKNLKGAVVFSILMQNNEGIMGKSPMYIQEKFIKCAENKNPEYLLDEKNTRIFNDWVARWNGLDND